MGRWCVAGMVVLLLSGEAVRAQVPPPPPPPPMPPQGRDAGMQKPSVGTARLSGRVTALETGRPIRRAVVRAVSQELQEGKSVSTDLEGRWELRELPAGRYNVSVSKGGYVSLAYGQLRPFESGKSVELSVGQTVDRLDVALPRGSAVTGRVVDEFGDPVTNARVTAMRLRYLAGQRRMMAMGAGDSTDDLGQFRLHGLPPGEYYVAAQAATSMLFGASEDRSGYAQTFYPGVITPSEATRVTLAVGQEAQNIVITLTPIRTATISGTARTAAGNPVASGMVMMRSTNPAEMMMSVRSSPVRNGEWTISNVTPGDYFLMLQAIDLEQVALTGTTSQTGREIALEPITVTGDDIKGLSIVTSAGATLRGSIHFEDAAQPPAFSSMGVQALDPSGPESVIGLSAGMVKPDLSFEVRGVFGRRILRIGGLPPGWTLKEVRYGGQDVTDTGIGVTGTQEISGLEIVVTQKAAELGGTVQTGKGTPTSDYVVVLFSSDRETWGWQSRFVRSGRPDQTGTFSIRNLPPASYLAVALEYLEPGEETNPETLERLRGLATHVRLDEGEKKTITLRLVAQ